ncbi:MAG TPA: hypothetical protein PKA05_07900 [Roseiflexaceae bacterium]|nr:hypothetical protein [Roseiflexaceae bacterium]
MSLSLETACRPFLPGGLPYRSATQALEISRRYAGTFLAWPQLPQRSPRERGLIQSMCGFPGAVIDHARGSIHVDRALAARRLDELSMAYLEHDLGYAALTPDDAAGLAELQRQAELFRSAVVLKGQILGPISVAAQLTDEQQRPLIYDQVLFDAIVQFLRLRIAWQEKQLRAVALQTIMCVEEPLLDIIGQPFLPLDWNQAAEQITLVLGGVNGRRAVAAGGAVEWSNILLPPVDLIIADVVSYGHGLVAAAVPLAEFVASGGMVGFGIVPTDDDLLASTQSEILEQRFERLIDTLARAGVNRDQLVRQALIAPTGTLGYSSTETAERVLLLLADLSHALRQRYGFA